MLLTLLAGCGQKSKLNEAEIKAYADTILENILVAANKDDYVAYSKDFSDKMKANSSDAKQQYGIDLNLNFPRQL